MLEEKLKEMGSDKKCPIAIMVRDGKVLTGQRNYTKDKWKDISVWTIPGGRCDPGETLQDALRREVLEEVGITEFEIVDFVEEVSGVKEGDIVPIFFCTTNQEARLMEPEKFSEWIWLPISEYITGSHYSGFNPVARKTIVNYLQNKNPTFPKS